MSRYLLAAPALALCFAGAPALADGHSYNFVQAAYESVDIDIGGGLSVDGNGLGVAGSFEINDDIFVFASYAKADFDFGIDFTTFEAGLGWHTGLTEQTDFYATLAYVNGEVDGGGLGSYDDNGYAASIGLRHDLSEAIELFGSISYVDFGNGDSTGIGGGFLYNFTDTLSAGLEISADDDVTTYGAAVRLYFGN